MSHERQRVLVTGAASGIGRDTVRRFHAAGAHVVAVDRDAGGLEALAAELEGLRTVTADLAVHDDVELAMDAMEERIDVLVNNAAIMDRMLLLDELSLEQWERVMAVNVTAPFLLARRAVPLMVAQGGGVVVNVASIAGLRGGRAGTAYTTSKHALIGMTRSIAVTFGAQGVRANAVCPGGIRGGAKGAADEPGAPDSERGAALIRDRDRLRPAIGAADEVAAIVQFLASPEASRINGAEIVADGGALTF
jgi:NAD(P)-dependent dehydrogenase (short-subunit alcohol dehydrogenase family)